MKLYNKRTWLNDDNSPSTGNVICYDGMVKWNNHEKPERSSFIQISDCYSSIKLHKSEMDTTDDFIKKLELLNSDITEFIEHLKTINF